MKYLLVLFTFWLSFLMAIDFFETPIRFSTKHLNMIQALRIGRNLFKQLLRLEFIFLVLALFHAWKMNLYPVLFIVIALGFLLIIQQFYLLPILEERAIAFIAGEEVPTSWHHTYYVSIEVIKCVLLSTLVLISFNKL